MLALQRTGRRPLVIGHRGAAGHAPENTFAAFRIGADLGSDLVECDVHVSRDGHAVVIHDDALGRTTGSAGLVRELDLADLRRLDAGSGERIPTLDELLAWAAAHPPLGVVVEIKNGPWFYPDIDRHVAGAIARHGLADRVVVVSFDHEVVRSLKERLPSVATGILYYARLADPVGAARAALADCLWPNVGMLTPELVQAAHQADLAVITWTANLDPEFDRAAGAGVDGVGTDFPDRLIAYLGG